MHIRHRLALSACLVLAVSCGTPHAHSGPHTHDEAPPEPEQMAFDMMDPAAMAEMMALAQPGPEHERLAKYAGAWQGEISMAMAPGVPEMITRAPLTARTVLGGRFLELTSSGEMMGHPFDSVSFVGYDRRNEVWTLVGLDTMGTYWVTATGKEDADGTIRMHGTDDSPMGLQEFFFEMRFVSDDEFTSAVYFTRTGPQVFDEPFKMVEIRYTRL